MEKILVLLKIILGFGAVFGFIGLIAKLGAKMEEASELRKKKLEIKMREMEAASEEKILNMQHENDNARTATTIVGNIPLTTSNQVDKSILMAQIKCVQCGASIESGSKFCKFCGTAIPDLTQKAELTVETVNKARIRQEELKHELEVKRLEVESKAKRAEERSSKMWAIIALLIICGICYLMYKK